MSELDRKDFLKLTITVVTTACFSQACGEEEPTPSGTGGVSGAAPTGGMAGQSTGGTATGGTATGGTATGGTATGGTATGGTATGGAGGAGAGGAGAGGAGAGGAGSGSGGAGSGSGGAGSGSGGAGAGGMAGGGRGGMAGGGRGGMGGAAGGGGGMCMDPVAAMQTGNDMHTHTLTIMAAQINSGMMAFTTGSASNHTHMVMLTTGDLTQLRMGMAVTKTSSTDNNHSHMYSIECA
jgi:hypothetical protein